MASIADNYVPVLGIVLATAIPICLAVIIGGFILHRRHQRLLNLEDKLSHHNAADYGMDEVTQKAKKKKKKETGLKLNDTQHARERSMEFDVPVPYLLPPGVVSSRESLYSLSKNAEDNPFSVAFHPESPTKLRRDFVSFVDSDTTSNDFSVQGSLKEGPFNRRVSVEKESLAETEDNKGSISTLPRGLAPVALGNHASEAHVDNEHSVEQRATDEGRHTALDLPESRVFQSHRSSTVEHAFDAAEYQFDLDLGGVIQYEQRDAELDNQIQILAQPLQPRSQSVLESTYKDRMGMTDLEEDSIFHPTDYLENEADYMHYEEDEPYDPARVQSVYNQYFDRQGRRQNSEKRTQAPPMPGQTQGRNLTKTLKKPLPAQVPLTVIPLASKVDLDAPAHNFAPPKRSNSPAPSLSETSLRSAGLIKSPLVNTYADLRVLPNPRDLRNSSSFGLLDFAPPKRFNFTEDRSDAGSTVGSTVGSIRSIATSRQNLYAIQNGAGRLSRIGVDLVFPKDAAANGALKPEWHEGQQRSQMV